MSEKTFPVVLMKWFDPTEQSSICEHYSIHLSKGDAIAYSKQPRNQCAEAHTDNLDIVDVDEHIYNDLKDKKLGTLGFSIGSLLDIELESKKAIRLEQEARAKREQLEKEETERMALDNLLKSLNGTQLELLRKHFKSEEVAEKNRIYQSQMGNWR